MDRHGVRGMTDGILYAFEELSDDLPRPPLVAVRALLSSGIIPSPKGWASLPVETRVAIARHGLAGVVDIAGVRELAQQIPPRYLKLVSRSRDPNPDEVPPSVAKALGPSRPISDGEWRSLRAVDRGVMASLAANTRLIARAYDELAPSMGKVVSVRKVRWSGAIAHCEVHLNEQALLHVVSGSFLEGRALMLARVAGIRAARRIAETFDLHADSATGPVELDGMIQHDRGLVLWQAHVSSWDGAFFPAAALLAVTTAATALFDMIKEEDGSAHIEGASIRDESWQVGAGATDEEATQLYSPGGWSASSPRQASKEEIERLFQQASAKKIKGARAEPDLDSTFVDPPGSTPGNAKAGEDPDLGANKDTVKDLAPGIAPLIDQAAASGPAHIAGAEPLVDLAAPPSSGAGFFQPPSQPRPAASQQIVPTPDPSYELAEPVPGTPKALLGLLVASLVILALALGIFGYVLMQSM
jgi:molybdenum cofactor biosynthesis enzyme